jgi:hypothetical protein
VYPLSTCPCFNQTNRHHTLRLLRVPPDLVSLTPVHCVQLRSSSSGFFLNCFCLSPLRCTAKSYCHSLQGNRYLGAATDPSCDPSTWKRTLKTSQPSANVLLLPSLQLHLPWNSYSVLGYRFCVPLAESLELSEDSRVPSLAEIQWTSSSSSRLLLQLLRNRSSHDDL